jgi:undecaprenyl diphosphate synthase
MIQSSLPFQNKGLHVGIIMDGNGRWANLRGRPRVAGHREGALAVRRTVEAAPDYGISILTLYAFSSDNWQRPEREVRALMRLLRAYLKVEKQRCIKNGVRIEVIGRRDRLADIVRAAIEEAEYDTRNGATLLMRIAIDYSSRDAILRAVGRINKSQPITREVFSQALSDGGVTAAPDVDLVIRTGGEQRLSDFLLWECAYAEFYFTKRMWPDFDRGDLAEAVKEFHARERRYGRVPQAAAD